jgi:hypothetical protein
MTQTDKDTGCWCCGIVGIEHEPFVEVVSMSEASAKEFAMPEAVKVVCVGQADPERYRFGARTYRLFRNWQAWHRYSNEKGSSK